jgi:chemotaxis protein MotB
MSTGGSAARAFALVVALGVGALAAHVYNVKVPRAQLERSSADTNAKLADCAKQRDEAAQARDANQRSAAESAQMLEASRTELDELRHEKEDTEKRLAVFKSITEKFRKMIDSGKLQVVIRHGRMIVKLAASVLFPSGSADLSKGGQTALTEVAHILKQVPDRRFEVAGHTDNVPVGPPSPFKSNLELSTARALTVANFLIGAGMSASRLSAAGYAEFQPVASNGREAGRQENRRIEIVLLPNLSELPAMPGDAPDAGAPAPTASVPAAADAGK